MPGISSNIAKMPPDNGLDGRRIINLDPVDEKEHEIL